MGMKGMPKKDKFKRTWNFLGTVQFNTSDSCFWIWPGWSLSAVMRQATDNLSV